MLYILNAAFVYIYLPKIQFQYTKFLAYTVHSVKGSIQTPKPHNFLTSCPGPSHDGLFSPQRPGMLPTQPDAHVTGPRHGPVALL